MAIRNRFGRFVKRGQKKRHRARRRRSNPHRRRRHTARRRRRSNPHMLLANPSAQLGLFDAAGHRIKSSIAHIRTGMKRRKRKGPKRSKRRARRAVATRRRRHGRRYYRIYRGRGRSPKYRIMRRGNPFGSVMALVRLGVAGGLGIVVARIGGRLYTDKLSKFVLGSGASDPKSFRAILNEGLRIVAMGALPILVERQLLRRLPMVTAADGMAFAVGGLAEAGRQAIGVVIKRVKPGVDAGRWGLDGPMGYVQYVDQGGVIYGQHPSGQWYALGESNGMSGLMSGRRFGMSGAVPNDEFGMAGDDDDVDDAVG